MEDWRLNGQERYLYKKKLCKKNFESSDSFYHAHCDFCWAKFSVYAEDLHSGFCTEDEYHWVCDTCFNDFKESFQWDIELD